MNQKAGRPPLPDSDRKGQTFRIRMTDEDRSLIEEAATTNGLAASEWARDVLLSTAIRAAKKKQT